MATVKQTNKQQDHNKAIQNSVSQEATKAQCGNQGSPTARSLEITECEPHGQYAHRFLDRIHRPVMTHSCGSWKLKMRGGETNCENGSKVKRQETTGGQGPLRVRSRVLCLSSALSRV